MLYKNTLMWDNCPTNISKDMVGFVYQIFELDSGKSYIGIKKFWKKIKYKPLKGKKNKRTKIIESDWKTYNSSCKELKEKIEKNPKNYVKVVSMICYSLTELKAQEAYLQLKEYLYGDWNMLYNEMINLRLRIRK